VGLRVLEEKENIKTVTRGGETKTTPRPAPSTTATRKNMFDVIEQHDKH
jgi:hypothetical protein